MKLAVVQLRLRNNERTDLAALLALVGEAADGGAGVIVCPRPTALNGDLGVARDFGESVREHAPGRVLVMPGPSGATGEETSAFPTPLGRTVALVGDACAEPAALQQAAALQPEALVWQPEAESGLQAEAFLELALGASLAIAGLVTVTAVDGRGEGRRGFGGAAIVQLGEVVAEAGDGDEILTADLEVPVPLPDRPGPFPELPPILAQRLAHHEGRRARVDWPADLA